MELNPLEQIEPVVVVATIAVFVLTFFMLKRVFFGPVIEVIEARRERCERAEEACAQADARLAKAEAESQHRITQARDDSEEVVVRAREEALSEKSTRMSAARERADRSLEAGRARILAERDREIERLAREARECVALACEKVAGGVDPSVVSDTVDELISRRLRKEVTTDAV